MIINGTRKELLLPLDTVLIKRIHFVEQVIRRRKREFRSSSLSGHLIHYIDEGVVEQECNGIKQTLRAGDLVWYEPNSIIKGVIKDVPWSFYTVGFESPNLPFLSAGRRVITPPDSSGSTIKKLFRLWKERHESATQESLQITSCLYEIVALCFPKDEGAELLATKGSSVWWEIEAAYTQSIDSPPPSVAQLAATNQITTKKLSELCKMTTGQSPKARLQTVRMAHMKGLLLLSDLTISEIAYHVGFQRVQDLSRACKEFFGMAPLEMRRSQQTFTELL